MMENIRRFSLLVICIMSFGVIVMEVSELNKVWVVRVFFLS